MSRGWIHKDGSTRHSAQGSGFDMRLSIALVALMMVSELGAADPSFWCHSAEQRMDLMGGADSILKRNIYRIDRAAFINERSAVNRDGLTLTGVAAEHAMLLMYEKAIQGFVVRMSLKRLIPALDDGEGELVIRDAQGRRLSLDEASRGLEESVTADRARYDTEIQRTLSILEEFLQWDPEVIDEAMVPGLCITSRDLLAIAHELDPEDARVERLLKLQPPSGVAFHVSDRLPDLNYLRTSEEDPLRMPSSTQTRISVMDQAEMARQPLRSCGEGLGRKVLSFCSASADELDDSDALEDESLDVVLRERAWLVQEAIDQQEAREDECDEDDESDECDPWQDPAIQSLMGNFERGRAFGDCDSLMALAHMQLREVEGEDTETRIHRFRARLEVASQAGCQESDRLIHFMDTNPDYWKSLQ